MSRKKNRHLTRWHVMVDGVRMYIPVNTMKVGDSIFIPCINLSVVEYIVRRMMTDEGFKLSLRERIEQGVLGLRFWRVL